MAREHPPNFIHALTAATQHAALAPEIPAYLGFEPGAILSFFLRRIELPHSGGENFALGSIRTTNVVNFNDRPAD